MTSTTAQHPTDGDRGARRPLARASAALARHLYSQFGRPRGPLGVMAGRIMAKRGSNVERNVWLIERAAIEPEHLVLELGPGPGVALVAAARAATDGHVYGVDHSSTMLEMAARRARRAGVADRVTLIQGRAQVLHYDLRDLDRIYAMNVWLFWDDQEAVIAHFASRLAPGGRLLIGHQPRTPGATAADTDAAGRCIADQLREAGLEAVTIEQLDLQPTPVTLVVGQRPEQS